MPESFWVSPSTTLSSFNWRCFNLPCSLTAYCATSLTCGSSTSFIGAHPPASIVTTAERRQSTKRGRKTQQKPDLRSISKTLWWLIVTGLLWE
ncbi:hypothetical protein Tsubulata_024496 [Turnera subulata]|uniref:Uncharacterized protein n=1 Tax=Turnera subulata TaxID=218843 RepID=A0A9Q0GFR0_9ROSI|nr:hypothetical protein Tsubulata_024496 [Turnera subulata]